MIYSILEQYERAFLFFQNAISITGTAISQISIESYKKYVLISLLLYGKLQPMSKTVVTYLNRSIKPFCVPYNKIVVAYSNDSIDDLQEICLKFFKEFSKDSNIGLVKLVIASLTKVRIKNLTKTFITLSLKDIAIKVNLPSPEAAEKQILQMIENGEIYASINQKDGMVEFSDYSEKYDSLQMYKTIEHQINQCISLNEKLKQLDYEVAINPKYIQKTHNDDSV
ncbi:mitogen-activated protein kinase kinase MKK4 [Sarcoptes scabiei]|nr:mitogen-activated protein kinase kinase MKK4 [Sarcoptes scabiei]